MGAGADIAYTYADACSSVRTGTADRAENTRDVLVNVWHFKTSLHGGIP